MGIYHCYKLDMELKDWLEEKYLKWQLDYGRATIKEFANYLGISRSYLNLLLNGERDNISREKAIKIADKTNDLEILEILGYSIPKELSSPSLPPALRESFDQALDEIEREYKVRGITDLSSDEALAIAKEILEEHGWNVET